MIEYSAVTLSKDDLNSQGRLRDLLIFPYKYTETSTCILDSGVEQEPKFHHILQPTAQKWLTQISALVFEIPVFHGCTASRFIFLNLWFKSVSR